MKCCTIVLTENSVVLSADVSNKYLYSVSYTCQDAKPVGKKPIHQEDSWYL